MFATPAPTRYDLKWRMLGIPVRVHPSFWLMTALLGLDWLEKGITYLALWVGCVFVSVLAHECGHVLAGRLFGARGQILLYGFGGLAVGSTALRQRWQRIAVYGAGPAAGFVLCGLAFLLALLLDPRRESNLLSVAFLFLIGINLLWGLVNLLPVWPLDGGQISRDVCEWLMPRKGLRVALIVSLAVAGVMILNALYAIQTHSALPVLHWVPGFDYLRGPWVVVLFGLLAYSSYQALRLEYRRRR